MRKQYLLAVMVFGVLAFPSLASAAYGFSTSEPWARIVESDLYFPSTCYSRLTFPIEVIRSDGTYVNYAIDEVTNDASRYFRVLVDGVRYDTSFYSGSDFSRTVYVGVLSPGVHEIGIELYCGSYGYRWMLKHLALGGGNYRFAENDVNIAEESVRVHTLDDTQSSHVFTVDDTFRSNAPGAFIYSGSATGTGYFRVYASVVNDGAKKTFLDGYTLAQVKKSTIKLYARIIDNPSIYQGTTWLALDSVTAASSTQGANMQWNWEISAELGGEYGGIGASVSPSYVSSVLTDDDVTHESGGTYDSWRYLGLAEADFSSTWDQDSTFSVFFDVSFANSNANNWAGHNIQFKVDIINEWGIHENVVWGLVKGWAGMDAPYTRTFILGDGIGGVGSPHLSGVDRWLTIWPGSAWTN